MQFAKKFGKADNMMRCDHFCRSSCRLSRKVDESGVGMYNLGEVIILKLLMHTCCAPCSVMCIETLRAEALEPVLFWYNPNIHPCKEYKMRKNTLVEYAASVKAKLVIENEYGLRKFIEGVFPNFDDRCGFCYKIRFEETAKYAAEHGVDAFTSTLFISPYQNHELLKVTAEAASEKYGVHFLYRDFRPFFKEGQEKAREKGLYMQKHCGCIFSEEDRYKRRKKPNKKSGDL